MNSEADAEAWSELQEGKNLGAAWAIKFATKILDDYTTTDAPLEMKMLAQHATMILNFVANQGGCGEIPPGDDSLTNAIDVAVFG